MKKHKKSIFPVFIFPVLFLLNSCFGIGVDIVLNQNGSGTINLEYQISQSLDSLGRLDGNERWNTIPVGKADFERTLNRLPGMSLTSFSSREAGKNIVIRAGMEFENMDALLSFMDAGGRRSSFSGDPNSGSLVFTLSEGVSDTNQSFRMLIRDITESYFVKMSMRFPREGRLVITDNRGFPLPTIPGSDITANGRTVSFSLPVYEILSSSEGIIAEFHW